MFFSIGRLSFALILTIEIIKTSYKILLLAHPKDRPVTNIFAPSHFTRVFPRLDEMSFSLFTRCQQRNSKAKRLAEPFSALCHFFPILSCFLVYFHNTRWCFLAKWGQIQSFLIIIMHSFYFNLMLCLASIPFWRLFVFKAIGRRDHLQLKGLAKAAMTIDAFIEQWQWSLLKALYVSYL